MDGTTSPFGRVVSSVSEPQVQTRGNAVQLLTGGVDRSPTAPGAPRKKYRIYFANRGPHIMHFHAVRPATASHTPTHPARHSTAGVSKADNLEERSPCVSEKPIPRSTRRAKAAFVPVQIDATPSPTALDREQARKKIKEQARPCTYPQPNISVSASTPDSLLFRRGQDGPHNRLRSATRSVKRSRSVGCHKKN